MALKIEITEYREILTQFQLQPQSIYIVCASLVIAVNLAVVYFFLREKFHDEPQKVSNVMLISLAISDIVYEVTTTPLFLQCDSEKTPMYFGNCWCRTLCVLYMMFNISITLHFVFALLVKSFEVSIKIQRRICFVFWCISFLLADMCSWEGISFMNTNALAYLGRFKAFGYCIFFVVAFSFSVLIFFIIGVMKCRKEMENEPEFSINKRYPSKEETDLEFLRRPRKRNKKLVFCYLLAAFHVVGSFGWLLVGSAATGDIVRSFEVMKCFEIIRLAARFFNSTTLFFP